MGTELSRDEQKKLAAVTAVDSLIQRGYIFSGMKIGLGTGSTAMPAVEYLARRIADGTLTDIRAATTSLQTSVACENLGIPVCSLNSKEIGGYLDLAIDGADEIDPYNNLIKGGGAALLLEKIVAYNSKCFVVVADSTKNVPHLGTGFALPVEVVPEARNTVIRRLERYGIQCVLREGVKKAGPVITDNGNIILDIRWPEPVVPGDWESELNMIPGVVENGFFTRQPPLVFIANPDGTVMERLPPPGSGGWLC